jgi:hypothetical protein
MFCPVCKAEYREGFTRCSDCEVPLVSRLSSPESGDSSESPELLWSGTDGGIFARLTEALHEAEIPYNDEQTGARLIYSSAHTPLQVWTLKGNHDAAQAMFDSVVGSEALPEETDAELDAQENELPEEPSGPQVDDLVENFDPHEATMEVWHGEDGDLADMIRVSLRENGIGCVLDNFTPPLHRLSVYPSDKLRAREIIREIIEATPPE